MKVNRETETAGGKMSEKSMRHFGPLQCVCSCVWHAAGATMWLNTTWETERLFLKDKHAKTLQAALHTIAFCVSYPVYTQWLAIVYDLCTDMYVYPVLRIVGERLLAYKEVLLLQAHSSDLSHIR